MTRFNVSIGGGDAFTGISFGGGGGMKTAGMSETNVGGVRIQFSELRGGRRDIVINGNSSMSLSNGSTMEMSMNGVKVRTSGCDLWVNGTKVEFDGKQRSPSEIAAEEQRAATALKARFPGVVFEPGFDASTIDASVKIVPGARLSGTPQLRGTTVIGATAVVDGGVITNSTVHGEVSGGVLNNATVDKGGCVSGGVLNSSKVLSGGHVSGGVLNSATVANNASVSGGILNGTHVAEGRKISGGIN